MPEGTFQRRTRVTPDRVPVAGSNKARGRCHFFLSKWFWFSGGEKVLGFRRGRLDLAGDGPDKAGEFTGDGGDGDLGFLFTRAGEVDVTVV